MARSRNPLPSYLPHKQSGKGRIVWTDALGVRRFEMLPGPFNSAESKTAFAQRQLELATAPVAVSEPNGITVNELLVAYLEHASAYYRTPDGSPSDEVRHVKAACREVRQLYGELPVAEFGPLALKSVRQKFLTEGWCRNTVNARVERVRRIFKWGVAEELVKSPVYQALAAVEGLKRGRTTAPEPAPVAPVKDAVVEKSLQYLNRHVRGLVEFQRQTGCRPGEACAIRRCDLDTGGAVWIYKPIEHKGSWRGKSRTIAIGPKAQALLREYFTTNIEDYLFSPRRAVEEALAERSAARATPRYPSHMKRNEGKRIGVKRKRPPADRYTRHSYGTAVDRACDRAFPPVGELARLKGESVAKWWARLTTEQRTAVKAWRKVHRWAPNRLRHSYGTRARKLFSLEHAGAALGHSKMSATEIYAERDAGLAMEVAAKLG